MSPGGHLCYHLHLHEVAKRTQVSLSALLEWQKDQIEYFILIIAVSQKEILYIY